MPSSSPRDFDAAFLALVCLFSLACEPTPAPPSPGETLARAYCSTCHRFPEPELLARTQWEALLPDMGGRLGVYQTVTRDSLIQRVDLTGLDPAFVYPTSPALEAEAWQAIVDYFMAEAPDRLAAAPREQPVEADLANFTVRSPRFRFEPPLTTLAHIQDNNRLFFIGNYGESSTLVVINAKGDLLFEWTLTGDPVDVHWEDGKLMILLIGRGPEPMETSLGAVVSIDGTESPVRTRIAGLKRPVDMNVGDLTGDGRDDVVICEFGNEQGYVSWYEQSPDGTYTRHVLAEKAGASESVLHDFNGDGQLDIGVLMAQGDEGIDIYTNLGEGRFEAKRVLRFPPVYGSNHIELADFNGDGIQDILYAGGDNADITNTLKPYHGIRIFLGNTEGEFEPAYFFPLHGAEKAQAADFDGDGDLDIAAIAFFPDYSQTPEESFVLLQQTGDLEFEPTTFDQSFRGRWLVMDVGDVDGDQDADILLGSNIGFAPENDPHGLFDRWMKEGPSFVLLENQAEE